MHDAPRAAVKRVAAMHRRAIVPKHQIAHLQFVHPDDRQRFRRLGVIANAQPFWAVYDGYMRELTLPFVGPERALWQYQIGSLLGRGTRIAFGSDWPVSSADPLQEIHVAVNRVLSERLGRPGRVYHGPRRCSRLPSVSHERTLPCGRLRPSHW